MLDFDACVRIMHLVWKQGTARVELLPLVVAMVTPPSQRRNSIMKLIITSIVC